MSVALDKECNLTLSEIKVQKLSLGTTFSKGTLLYLLGSNMYTLSTNMYL